MRTLMIIVASILLTVACSKDWQDSKELGQLFEEAGVKGTFVLLDANTGQLTVHNPERAHRRFIPASTFKIPNSLIGLSVEAVKDVDEVLPYGGEPQPYPAWEKDMGLREAIKISNVPIYQELARRIGLEKMTAGVENLGFGNQQIGDAVDRFWLDGPLEISAVEQVGFLAHLARSELPVAKEVQASVREIAMLESGKGYVLYGKTGWGTSTEPGIGWWVGWVEKGEHVYAFALNMDISNPNDLPKRVELGKACLKKLGVL